MSSPICTCWRLNPDRTHEAGCAVAKRQATEAYLNDRGHRPRITRRWSPRLDVHMRYMAASSVFCSAASQARKPWRIDLPADNTGGITEYAATWAEALSIAQWWVNPVGYLASLPTIHDIPNITNDTESEHGDDL